MPTNFDYGVDVVVFDCDDTIFPQLEYGREHEADLFPGVAEMFELLHRHGIKLVLISGGRSFEIINGILDKTLSARPYLQASDIHAADKLEEHFAHVKGPLQSRADFIKADLPRVLPSALHNHHRVLLVDDNEWNIADAKAAGMQTLQVPLRVNGLTKTVDPDFFLKTVCMRAVGSVAKANTKSVASFFSQLVSKPRTVETLPAQHIECCLVTEEGHSENLVMNNFFRSLGITREDIKKATDGDVTIKVKRNQSPVMDTVTIKQFELDIFGKERKALDVALADPSKQTLALFLFRYNGTCDADTIREFFWHNPQGNYSQCNTSCHLIGFCYSDEEIRAIQNEGCIWLSRMTEQHQIPFQAVNTNPDAQAKSGPSALEAVLTRLVRGCLQAEISRAESAPELQSAAGLAN